MRVHAAIAACFATLLLATVAALDGVGRASPQPGTVWMLRSASIGTELDAFPPAADARLLDVVAGGHVLRVHVRSLRATSASRAWMLRWPVAELGWPACG